MTKSEILHNLLIQYGDSAIGRTEEEKNFTRFIIHTNGKSFACILPKNEKGGYDFDDVMEITKSAIKHAKQCSKRIGIFQRIVNGLWK